MSAEKLKLTHEACDFYITSHSDKFKIEIMKASGYRMIYLDRSQAHSLMLYLQEHLNDQNELEGAWK